MKQQMKIVSRDIKQADEAVASKQISISEFSRPLTSIILNLMEIM